MACIKMFTIFLASVAIAIPLVSGKEFVVGDDKGWTLNFDHQAWTQGKEFHVGDKLIFRYPSEKHNVMKVDGVGFQQCAAPANTEALTTGEDVITLATPGRKWYICGVGQHCASGNMKLLVTVLPDTASPGASPAPASPAPGTSTSAATSAVTKSCYVYVAVALLGFLAMLVN